MRRIAAGEKRATIVAAGRNRGLAVGDTVTAGAATARVPLQITGVAGPVERAGVEAVATAAGLTLADFTVAASWDTYLQDFVVGSDKKTARGPFLVVSFTVAGEMSGTIPKRQDLPKKKKKKPTDTPAPETEPQPTTKNEPKSASQVQPKTGPASASAPNPAPNSVLKKSGQAGWTVVSASTPLRPNNQLHPEDVTVLSTRISQALDRLQPPLTTRQSLMRVIGALLEERVCGPDGLPNTVGLRGDLGTATAWLAQNKLLAGKAWNPRLVAGLRRVSAVSPPPPGYAVSGFFIDCATTPAAPGSLFVFGDRCLSGIDWSCVGVAASSRLPSRLRRRVLATADQFCGAA